jgi:hypothetical protein
LGGHPQFAFSSALLLSLYASVRWIRDDKVRTRLFARAQGWQTPLRLFFEYFAPLRLIPAGLFFGVGAAIAAVQLAPMFELAGFTNRAGGLDARFFNAFSLRPIHYLMLADPFIQGNPYPGVSVEVVGYVGLFTFVLAIGAIVMRRDRRTVFFALIAVLALYLGLGDQSLLYRAFRHLPLFNYFRVPSRFLFWYTFAAAMLGGIALDELLTRARSTVQMTLSEKTVIAVFVVLVGIILIVIPSIPLSTWLGIWSWLPIILALFIVWVLLGARRGLFTRTTLIALVLGLTVVDLALFGAVYAKTYDTTVPVADFYRTPSSYPLVKTLTPQEGRVSTSLWVYPWQGVMRESLYPNISLIYGVPSATGYTPLIPQRTSDYLEQMTAPAFNLMGIRYYFVPQLLPVDPDTEGGDWWNDFLLNPVNRDVAIPATTASQFRITSSVSQSVGWKQGLAVAEIYLTTQDDQVIHLTLRAGIDTAEWAYERSDVRRAIPYAMPSVATTFDASSAFPMEAHQGHMFLAQYDLANNGKAPVITGLYIYPNVDPGLIHIEQAMLVTPEGNPVSIAHLVGRDDQTLVYRTNDVAVFKNPDALARTFIIHEAHVASDPATEVELFRDDFKPRESLILADGEPIQTGGAQRSDEEARIVEYKNDRVVLSVRASAEGYVLLTDAWYPGWVARLDGVEAPIRRGDLIFRAIKVGPGDHRIEFEYQPRSMYLGAVASVLGLLVVAGTWIGSRRVRRVVI